MDLNYDGRISYNSSRNNSANESIISKISTGLPITDNIAYINNRQKRGRSHKVLMPGTKLTRPDRNGRPIFLSRIRPITPISALALYSFCQRRLVLPAMDELKMT
jgi:hypothetical protein